MDAGGVVAPSSSPRKLEMSKARDRQEIKNALSVVVTALDKGQVTKDEMDMLSHALGMYTVLLASPICLYHGN